MLTELVVDVVWDVDVAVGPLFPQAVAGRARVSVPLRLAVDGDVSLHQHGLIRVESCKAVSTGHVDYIDLGLFIFECILKVCLLYCSRLCKVLKDWVLVFG